MNTIPKISIVTPSFNQGKYIEQTITSILQQQYSDLEYIIIDGGSTDNTLDILKKYDDHISYWVSEPDEGQANALNKGFDIAKGDLLCWVNSDDRLLPGTLNKIARIFNDNKASGVIVGLSRIIDSTTGLIRRELQPIGEVTVDSLFRWMESNNFCQPASIFTREVWETCGPFDENIYFAFDLDFWIKIKKKNFDFFVINDILAEELYHPEAKTVKFRRQMVFDIAMVIARHGGYEYSRPYLDDMLKELLWYEKNFNKLKRHPLFRVFYPIVKNIYRPAVRMVDIEQFWYSKKNK